MAKEKTFQDRISSSSEKYVNFSSFLQAISQQQFEQLLQFLIEKNNFELLDLSNNQLGDEKFLSIFDVICSNHTLQMLDISYNNITGYAVQKIVSKLLLQNMISYQGCAQLQMIKLMGNALGYSAIRHLSGLTWIRKNLKIYVLDAYIPYCALDKEKICEIFSDGTVFLDHKIAYQKAKNVEPHRDIFLMKVQIPAHAIEVEREKDFLKQTSISIPPQFKADLIVVSQVDLTNAGTVVKTKNEKNNFLEYFVFKKQNCRIALEYLFRSIQHLEHILEHRLNQLDISKDGKQYLLIQCLLGKNELKQDILSIYLIKLKLSKLQQKQIFEEDLCEIGQDLFEISNYLKKSIHDVDSLLKEFHEFIENIFDNLFVPVEPDAQKQRLSERLPHLWA